MAPSNLTRNILIGMGLGIILGSIVHFLDLAEGNPLDVYLIDGLFDLGGQIFVLSLKLLVVPLVFVSLVCGASNLGAGSSMGRIGLKTIILYLFTTATAISIALIVASIVDPGVGINLPTTAEYVAKQGPSLKQVFVNIFPSNPIRAMSEGNMLQVIVFAILIGIAITKSGDQGLRVKAHLDDWNEIIMRLVMMLMAVAPIGVFCLLISLFSNMGFSAIADLIKYFLTVVAVLAIHYVVTFGLMIKFVAKLDPLTFFKKMGPVMAYAFSTSSSNATLPMTLSTVEKKIGVKNEVASFTVPLGATINMDGTAIMQGVATVFIAQAFNQDIGFAGYVMVILTATLASIGTAGVPGVGLIMLALVLQQVGLPVEGIALIIGVDRLLDMMRTAVNVTGDATVSAIVARSEDKFDLAVFESKDEALQR
ncbi:MAG: dicarboxylate/amino acid:cation symporter [Pseudomonadales bacterium]|jgi:Na+/H+-dicarboxylate symporter|nr:dicarboxylate/amino acid:cation symporter [Pseudomonadales bacterium]MDG1442554.1 dicarboxylate/amino acid:cation symporter [Pseudomonadales bacterium]